jgi:serine/threonine protein kinase
MRICPDCGSQVPDLYRFCLNCGAKVTALQVQTPAAEQTFKRGRYTLVRLLGQGGFGKTFLVMDELIKEKRVIKQFLPDLSLEPAGRAKALELFKREAEVMMHLSYPRIPKVFDFFDEGGTACLVQQFIEGRTLGKIMDVDEGTGLSKNKLSESEVLDILEQLLKTLQYLQSQRPPKYHRDVKPGNIIIDSQNRAYLVDFGAVKERVASGMSAEKGSTVIYTEGYAPGEQLRGSVNLSIDLYALGATMIQALAGVHPSNLYDAYKDCYIWRDKATVNSNLADFLDKMTSPLASRFEDASQALQALHDLKAQVSGQVTTPGKQQVVCPHGHANDPHLIYCTKCYAVLNPRLETCLKCLSSIPINAAFCPECGARQVP